MVHKLMKAIVKSGARMETNRKSGLRSGERSIELARSRSGARNGRLISKQGLRRVSLGARSTQRITR